MTGVLYRGTVRILPRLHGPEDTDPELPRLTFASWSSILEFGAAGYAAKPILKTGRGAGPWRRTSREEQEAHAIIPARGLRRRTGQRRYVRDHPR